MITPVGQREITSPLWRQEKVKEKEMTTVKEPRAGARAARGSRLEPPTRLTAWSLYALAALVFLVTIVMIVRSGAAPCARASVSAARHHAPNPACAATVRYPVPGRR